MRKRKVIVCFYYVFTKRLAVSVYIGIGRYPIYLIECTSPLTRMNSPTKSLELVVPDICERPDRIKSGMRTT
jgi:hypothetical protein